MRTGMTLEIEDAYSFDETFELAMLGEELAYYLTVHWVREPHIDD